MNKTYDAARKVLEFAIQEASGEEYTPQTQHFKEIKAIISGKSKTYPYIMVTAVLAKSVTPSIHPRALQKKSSLPGAYDARGLCENVIIPVERELLAGGFGNSPSPFLSKPARYPEVSMSNPDRMRAELERLYNFLESIKDCSSQDAFSILCDIIHIVSTKKAIKNLSKYKNIRGGPVDMVCFADSILEQSCSGQSSVLIAATALSMIYGELEVITHPINQCGASSRQILDIDVYDKDRYLVGAAEVKDKIFGIEDVGMAADKAIEAGLSSFLFLLGPNAVPKDKTLEELEAHVAKRDVTCCFISVRNVIRQATFTFDPRWVKRLKHYERQLKISPKMATHLEACFKNIFQKRNIMSTITVSEIPAFDIVRKVVKEK